MSTMHSPIFTVANRRRVLDTGRVLIGVAYEPPVERCLGEHAEALQAALLDRPRSLLPLRRPTVFNRGNAPHQEPNMSLRRQPWSDTVPIPPQAAHAASEFHQPDQIEGAGAIVVPVLWVALVCAASAVGYVLWKAWP